MKNSFFLVLPPQQKNSEHLKLYEEDTLRQWIADLPTANQGLTTRLFHDFIRDFNKIEMDVQLRLDTLETLKLNFFEIEDYLRIRLSKMGFPKGENEQKILKVVTSIEQEFALGYWIVVRALTRRGTGWFQGKNIALSIQRTIKNLGYIVVTYYMMCLPVPDWVWIDLHSLYKLSIKVKKENIKIPDDLDNPSDVSTITENYIQILLLSLTDPRGLMQKEVQQVYNFLGKFGNLVHLQKKPISMQMLQCVVLVDEDAPPEFERTEQPPNSGKLYLNFTDLYKVIEQRDKVVNKNCDRFNSINIHQEKTSKLATELIDYLEQRWIGSELQGTPCFVDRLDRIFSIGLETTYELQSSNTQQQNKKLEYLAQSSSKRSLSCSFNTEGLISTGSLVSFRKIDSPQNTCSLGIVNKIIVPKHEHRQLDFEIRLITSRIYAVSYTLKSKMNEDILQKALFYKEKDMDNEKHFIIVDSYLLKEGNTIKLSLSTDKFLVKLLHKKNVGLGYWQFECKRKAETKTIKKTKIIKEKQGYDFI